MARQKQPPSQTTQAQRQQAADYSNGHIERRIANAKLPPFIEERDLVAAQRSKAGILQLLVCVGGIYASFLTWGLLQERITTTPHRSRPSILGAISEPEYFRFPVVLNSIQSICAFISGSLYLYVTSGSTTSILPSRAAYAPLIGIALTSTLASPFGYASLAHVDYLTFVLAKSCKLLPVMFLHVLLYCKRYPMSKYLIVLAVTAGVAMFTIYHPPKPGKLKKNPQKSSYYGLSLLAINLLFDGLTNTTQDQTFSSPQRYGRITGPQMMAATNLISFVMMTLYLLLTPYIPSSLLPTMASGSIDQLSLATTFLQRHPAVLYDVLGFCVCGAVGQLFIFATLERFSSLLLVTVTVTRKMLTMLLSVVWYGKSLSPGQWVGVGLVFGGIATEALLAAEEKKAKMRLKEKEKAKKEGKKEL